MKRVLAAMFLAMLLACGPEGPGPAESTLDEDRTADTQSAAPAAAAIRIEVPPISGTLAQRVARLRPLAS